MFALIFKNTQIYDDINNNNKDQHLKKLEALNVELRNKEKMVREPLNVDEIFNNSNISNLDEFKSQNQTFLSHVSADNNQGNYIFNKTYCNSKVDLYKKYIKFLDLISIIFILSCALISQYENELYYYDNINYRVVSVVLMNGVFRNPYNHTLHDSLSKVNIIQLTDYNRMPDIMMNKNYTLVLQNLDMSLIAYNESDPDYNHINVHLVISDKGYILRLIIMYATFFCIIIILISRYYEHVRTYWYIRGKEVRFIKSEYLVYALLEILIILPIQYPDVNGYFIYSELGKVICLSYTSILSSCSIFRLLFIYKIFKHTNLWNSKLAEIKCEKYLCRADLKFAFKAIQKERPFLTLLVIFLLTVICFGLSLRNFELHFWETQSTLDQNWKYHWNAMWCIFVSITTVGYGDFYPKTHFGRFITIIACLVGIYCVSMMMVFMTKESYLTDSELKAYNLITRLKLRKEVKNIQSMMIYHSIKMYRLKNTKEYLSELEFDKAYRYQKRCIVSNIDKLKNKYRMIATFDYIPTKEQLYDICERIYTDIKQIIQDLDCLKYVNESMSNYTSSQVEIINSLKKNIYANKLIYDVIKNNNIYGLLNNLDFKLIDEVNESWDKTTSETKINEEIICKENGMKIKNIFDYDDENYCEEFNNNYIGPEEIFNHFNNIIQPIKIENKRNKRLESIIHSLKKNNDDLRHYHTLRKLSPINRAKSKQIEYPID